MSHFTRVRTTLRDAGLLAAALEEVGLSRVEVHEQPQPLHDYYGHAGPDRAEIVVRKAETGGASSDIGFAQQPDGSFAAVLDAMDRTRFDQPWMTRLTRAYSHVATLRYADAHGYEIATDTVEQDGTRRLTLRRAT